MNDEFDESEVLDLVAKALSEKGDKAFKSKSKLPLAMGDSNLLEKLSEILPIYLNQGDVQMVMYELRNELYKDLSVDETLEQLHMITRNCKKCPEVLPGSQIPHWNVADPDVVFVADSPSLDGTSMEMFTKTASGAGFTSGRLCMTFVNRCKKASRAKHTIEEINTCTPYLLSEIQILKPKLIIPLGLIATNAILGANLHLNEERGKIIWLGPWAILPTFSPSYVLRGGGNLNNLFIQDMEKAFNFVYGEK